MSAIYGIVGEGSLSLLRSIGERLSHRGTLTCEWEAAPGVFLGWRGFNETSFSRDSNSSSIVANASIYNQQEIASLLLEAPGEKSFNLSEQELIQTSFDLFGPECFSIFNGDFVIAVWDNQHQRLILARDRMGTRTLHYWIGPHYTAFASEYKAFYALEDFTPDPDLNALQHLQATKYLPSGRTLLKGVQSVLSATWIEIQGKETRGNRYWDLRTSSQKQPEGIVIEKVRSIFMRAMERRLESVGDLGVALSGGVDSTAVLAAMRQIRPNETIRTFTIGSGEEDPEIIVARKSAKFYDTEHFEVIIDPLDLQRDMPAWIWHLEDPIGRTEGYLYYRLMELASKYTDTIFVGAACDGLFGGMPRHKLIKMMQLFPLGRGLLEEFYHYTQISYLPKSLLGKAAIQLYFGKEELPAPCVIGTDKSLLPTPLPAQREGLLNEVLKAGIASGVPSWMPKIEKTCMAHGIGFRTPFTDNDMISYSFELPERFKIRGFKEKYIFRKALLPLIPPEVAKIPKFPQRMDYNLRLSEILDYLADFYLNSHAVKQRGFFKFEDIHALRVRRKGKAYSGNRAMRIWTAIVTEIWARTFLDARSVPLEQNLPFTTDFQKR